MTVRTDLETRLATWAASQVPPIEIAWEGVNYDKPASDLFVECFLSPSMPNMAGLGGTRYRDVGVFHINIWGLNGKGVSETETLAKSLVNFFPVFPKWADTSIERVGQISKAEIVNGYRVVPVTFYYRQETQTN